MKIIELWACLEIYDAVNDLRSNYFYDFHGPVIKNYVFCVEMSRELLFTTHRILCFTIKVVSDVA